VRRVNALRSGATTALVCACARARASARSVNCERILPVRSPGPGITCSLRAVIPHETCTSVSYTRVYVSYRKCERCNWLKPDRIWASRRGKFESEKIQVGSDDSVILLVDQQSERILDALHRLRVDSARLNRASGARKFGHLDLSRANAGAPARTKDFARVLRMQHPRSSFTFKEEGKELRMRNVVRYLYRGAVDSYSTIGIL